MMQRPTLALEIDGFGINPDDVEDIMITNSIDSVLPEMSFKIRDVSATIFPRLQIYIGARVTAYLIDKAYTKKIKDTDPDGNVIKERIQFGDFMVTRCYNGFEFGTEDGAGYIQVWCKHAWALFGDYSGHAYAPQKLSELIKSICKNANNIISLDVKDENFYTSSDKGAIPRYKSCESDLEFIESLLPFTNIDDSNAFFYIDLYNSPHLTSFAKMAAGKEKTMIIPQANLAGRLDDTVKDLCSSKGFNVYYKWADIKAYIGSEQSDKQVGQLREKVYLENNTTGKIYMGYQEPSSVMGSNSGSYYQTKVPINGLRLKMLDATSCEYFPNRIFGDALALARNDDSILEDLLAVDITIPEAITEVIPGDALYLLMPPKINDSDEATKDEKKKNVHWMNGKWVVHTVSYVMSTEENVSTSVRLIRSSLIFDTKTSTIDKPELFHTIGGE